MKNAGLTLKEKRAAVSWAEDVSWVDRKEYEKDEEYMEYAVDILENPIFQSMEQYIQHGHTTCRAHCIQVSYMAYRISKKFGLDARSAARAGLLHDLFLYDWHTHAKETGKHFHGFTHPAAALRNARMYFELNEVEENCILRHMWPLTPVAPRYWEGYTIVYADKVCGAGEVGRHIKAWMTVNWMPRRV